MKESEKPWPYTYKKLVRLTFKGATDWLKAQYGNYVMISDIIPTMEICLKVGGMLAESLHIGRVPIYDPFSDVSTVALKKTVYQSLLSWKFGCDPIGKTTFDNWLIHSCPKWARRFFRKPSLREYELRLTFWKDSPESKRPLVKCELKEVSDPEVL